MVTAGILLAIALQAYLLGSIASGILVSKYIYHDDVRNHGSGNAGMTNILRTYGKRAAAVTFIGDALKGVLSVVFGQMLFAMIPQLVFEPLLGGYLALIFAVVGHFKPIFFGFRGGKGVAVAAGCICALNPVVIAVLLTIFIVIFAVSRMVSLGSICAAIAFPISTILYGVFVQQLSLPTLLVSSFVSLAIGGAVVYMHRANITRIKDGTEYKFDGKPKA